MDRRLSAADFAKAFGSDEADIRRTVGPLVDKLAPGLKVYEGAERDELILKVLKRIYDIGLKSAGAERSGDWEDGWQENLDDFIACGYRVEALKPKYYKERVPHRFLGEFVLSEEPDFVYKYTVVFREWLFKTFFADAKTVYEFGCGTGHNLVHLGRLFPGKRLYGLDWAKSSQKILELARTKLGLDIYGANFDFFKPDESLKLEDGAAVLTFGALEQTGSDYKAYLEFILARRPALCVDVAGINDFYDRDSLMDYIALSYHDRRNYLNGYYAYLKGLEAKGRLKILRHCKHDFGNLYDDPYSFVVWKPL